MPSSRRRPRTSTGRSACVRLSPRRFRGGGGTRGHRRFRALRGKPPAPESGDVSRPARRSPSLCFCISSPGTKCHPPGGRNTSLCPSAARGPVPDQGVSRPAAPASPTGGRVLPPQLPLVATTLGSPGLADASPRLHLCLHTVSSLCTHLSQCPLIMRLVPLDEGPPSSRANYIHSKWHSEAQGSGF